MRIRDFPHLDNALNLDAPPEVLGRRRMMGRSGDTSDTQQDPACQNDYQASHDSASPSESIRLTL
jgi:hypothetical protein